jgi:hypothetical protein
VRHSHMLAGITKWVTNRLMMVGTCGSSWDCISDTLKL